MNKKSIYLIVVGSILVLLGFFIETIFQKTKDTETQTTLLEEQLLFERFVSAKFSPKYFGVVKTDSDILQNHLKITASITGFNDVFYVKTLWQKSYDNNLIKVIEAKEFKLFQSLSVKSSDLIFKVIGIGGSADSPKLIFVVPYTKVLDTQMRIEDLNKYKKANINSNFFFDIKTKTLN